MPRFIQKSMIACALFLCSPWITQAEVLTGTNVATVSSFDGTLAAIDVDLGAGSISTGPITFSLDTGAPTSYYFYNFNNGTISAELNLLIDAPILHLIGESPAKIHISESGSMIGGVPDLPVGGPQTIVLHADLHGGGVIEPGSVFSGTVYTNINDTTTVHNNVTVQPGGTLTIHQNNGDTTTVHVEAGVRVSTSVTVQPTSGDATAKATSMPETNSVVLMSIAAIGALAVRKWVKRRMDPISLEA
ncbi:hypothetical protein K2Y11_03500 [bacterium]|nr:hypothetical protein [bacterium]